jgi:peptidoglycan/LPS O-acetylase OafA/YrhL
LRAGWAFLPGIKGKVEQSTDEILSTTDLPATHSSKYRPDIDGLRAIAVGSVVAFHTGIPGVQGGFTGVDIFFVLSGFLITGILISEMDQGIFSYANFYERRVRRILPALFVMMGL